MSLALWVHITAGGAAIGSGVLAAFARKGGPLHRSAGKLFSGSMLAMALLGAGLALFGPPPRAGGAPPQASISVALLTLYLVSTGWAAVRRPGRRSTWPEGLAAAVAGLLALGLASFGVLALEGAKAASGFGPYFVFAAFAAAAGGLDGRAALVGPLSPPDRTARHLWRMLTALFFANAFFFIGQQRVLPSALHGSPILTLIAAAPLAVMAGWLFRIWATRRAFGRTGQGPLDRLLAFAAFRSRRTACAS